MPNPRESQGIQVVSTMQMINPWMMEMRYQRKMIRMVWKTVMSLRKAYLAVSKS
jgi:hypothetical protein